MKCIEVRYLGGQTSTEQNPPQPTASTNCLNCSSAGVEGSRHASLWPCVRAHANMHAVRKHRTKVGQDTLACASARCSGFAFPGLGCSGCRWMDRRCILTSRRRRALALRSGYARAGEQQEAFEPPPPTMLSISKLPSLTTSMLFHHRAVQHSANAL
jgi:hypothetical protein